MSKIPKMSVYKSSWDSRLAITYKDNWYYGLTVVVTLLFQKIKNKKMNFIHKS